MKKLIQFLFLVCMVGIMNFQSCTDENENPVFPLSADIFYSIDGKQVAFTALTHSAVSWQWDFGDGSTSTEQNPVYKYEDGGYYKAVLSATDEEGNTVASEIDLAVALTPYVLLTGGPTAENGKTWKLSQAHSENDKLVNSDLEWTLLDPDIESLPTGAFDLYLGLKEAYNDQFTFYYDGSYSHNTVDGSSFAGIVFASIMQQLGQTSITKTGGEAVFGADAFALATFNPQDNATFEFVESEDMDVYTIPSYATGLNSQQIPVVTYPGVMTIDFPDSNEFIGVMDFQRKVIVQNISDNSMRLVMFLCMSPDAIASVDPLIALNTTAMILTFEAVE